MKTISDARDLIVPIHDGFKLPPGSEPTAPWSITYSQRYQVDPVTKRELPNEPVVYVVKMGRYENVIGVGYSTTGWAHAEAMAYEEWVAASGHDATKVATAS